MDTYNQDMPTVPPPSRVPTDPAELARREKAADRKARRSRAAEVVAVAMQIAAALQAYYTYQSVRHAQPRPCVEARP